MICVHSLRCYCVSLSTTAPSEGPGPSGPLPPPGPLSPPSPPPAPTTGSVAAAGTSSGGGAGKAVCLGLPHLLMECLKAKSHTA